MQFRVLYTFLGNPSSAVVDSSTAEAARAEFERQHPHIATISGVEPVPQVRRSGRPRKTIITAAYDTFIDFLWAHGSIRAQVPPKAADGFANEFLSRKGRDVVMPSEHISLLNESVDKRGASLTILFPPEGESLVPAGLDCKNYIHDSTLRAVYNNDFAWELLSRGFEFGRQHGERPR